MNIDRYIYILYTEREKERRRKGHDKELSFQPNNPRRKNVCILAIMDISLYSSLLPSIKHTTFLFLFPFPSFILDIHINKYTPNISYTIK